MMHIGGGGGFEMRDDLRTQMNQQVLDMMRGNGDVATKVDTLLNMGGSIFNLKNTVPDALGNQISTELSALVLAARDEVLTGNRRLAQCLIDMAGPGEGLKNCAGLHNGKNYITTTINTSLISLSRPIIATICLHSTTTPPSPLLQTPSHHFHRHFHHGHDHRYYHRRFHCCHCNHHFHHQHHPNYFHLPSVIILLAIFSYLSLAKISTATLTTTLTKGWVFDNVLTEEAKIALLRAHASQWGVPDQPVRDLYPFAAAMYNSMASSSDK